MTKFDISQAAAMARVVVPALVLAAGTSLTHAQCTGFTINSSTGAAIVPGTADVGNHDDDLVTSIALPFPVSFYGASYSNVSVSSNGNLQFTTASNAYTNACLPASGMGVMLSPHWDDLRTDGTGSGIFTSVTGVAPNRVFNIEWRAAYYSANTTAVNFEVCLYENNSKVEYIYGPNPATGVNQNGSSATVGIQSGTAANQFECSTGGLSAGLKLTFTPINSSTILCSSAAASPVAVNNCSDTPVLLTVQVSPGVGPASTGISVTGNLAAIGGSAAQQFYDDGTHGDTVAGDNTFSYIATVPSSVTPGAKNMTFTSTDQQGRTGNASSSLTVNCVTAPNPLLGPDVVTFNITDVPKWGVNAAGDVTAYSVGTTSSNEGDYPVLWIDTSSYMPDYDITKHPVISQNMYRLKSYGAYSRFEQLGQSWLKHGFTSTNSTGPNGCTQPLLWRPSTLAYQSVGGDALGINCTDTYGGGLNGSQGSLGPKNIVNATTGFSPFTRGTGTDTSTNTNERLQVPTADIASQPAGTRFFVDAYYVTQDDAQFVRPGQTVAFNSLNNASWREITAASINLSPSFANSTQLHNPGIFAWVAADPAVALVTSDHDDAPNPGFPGKFIRSRYWTAAKVTALGGGLYRYEYAVYNHNSDRSAQRFSVPMPVAATVSDVTFHAPKWHSGEPYSNAPWTTVRSSTDMSFVTETFAANANANALRWGNLFNFGFTANVAPVSGAANITLFKPGTAGAPASIAASAIQVPSVPVHCGATDVGVQGGGLGQDGVLDNNDFLAFLDLFFAADSRADFGSQGGVPGVDGQLDNNDFVVFIDRFFAGC